MNNRFPEMLTITAFILALFTISCNAQTPVEQQSLATLRDLTKGGKLPAESVVADMERRFANTETALLARLVRARIRFENKDFRTAAELLDLPEYHTKLELGDYAKWLRGRSFMNAGDNSAAMAEFARLINDHPYSLRAKESKLLWAENALILGRTTDIPSTLASLSEQHSAKAYLLTAKALEAEQKREESLAKYRKAYIYGGTTDIAKEAEAKLKAAGQSLEPIDIEEAKARADRLFSLNNFTQAYSAYTELLQSFPAASADPNIHLSRITAAVRAKNMPNASIAFDGMALSLSGKDKAYFEMVNGYAASRLWQQTRTMADEMRRHFPDSPLTVSAWVNAGYAARDAKNSGEENFFLRTALTNYPNAVEVAGAQFELAWLQHEAKNYTLAADMLIEHLAKYAARDTTNRGKAGYWAARNAERAGRIAEACVLYDALVYRYAANWYGHIGFERLSSLRNRNQCQTAAGFPANSNVAMAAENLKTVTVSAETAGENELRQAAKSDRLSTIGLFDWALEELQEAQKTAENSPKINLALAQHHRMKGNNVAAFLALRRSYPDYTQMFPEEMGQAEWDIFYPHIEWPHVAAWAKKRNLDIYLVAGLIRQESVFDPRARSHANAYGLMQLLLPTARQVARKYGVTASLASANELYQPALNIELGTGYMRDQLDRFGRVEFMSVAYNAGPGRMIQWQRTLPTEMDEFAEAIPFRETRGYVQGIIRNTAQYRRLYEENGDFKPNVGSRPLRGEIDTRSREQFAAEFPYVKIDYGTAAE